jgi:hypothetical protein
VANHEEKHPKDFSAPLEVDLQKVVSQSRTNARGPFFGRLNDDA